MAATTTAILIGPPEHCERLQRQLALIDDHPVVLGWITPDATAADVPARGDGCDGGDGVVLGRLHELEAVIARRQPGLALITMPAVMTDCIAGVRTRLRRLGIADRFMPTLEDQLAGVGPRTEVDVDLAELIDRPAREIDEGLIDELIRGKVVLITGAGGSIGSELARFAAGFSPAKLLLMDRSDNALFEIDRQIARRYPQLAREAMLHDVIGMDATAELCRRHRPAVIFHSAAHKHVPMMEDHPGLAVANNLWGTKSIADAADACGAERFVMISSDKAVNPRSVMGATKRLAEQYVQWKNGESATSFAMVRFGNVLGSSGSVLEIWKRQIADGGPVTVTDPAMTRYFMSIPEAAALVMQAAAMVEDASAGSEVFMLDMGDPIRIVELAERFVRQHGLEPIVQQTATGDGSRGNGRLRGVTADGQADTRGRMPIVFTGGRPGEKLFEELSSEGEHLLPTRHEDVRIWRLDPPTDDDVAVMLQLLPARSGRMDAVEVIDRLRRLVPTLGRADEDSGTPAGMNGAAEQAAGERAAIPGAKPVVETVRTVAAGVSPRE